MQAGNQVGPPTSVNTGGKLGWALYAYMSPQILIGRCDGAQSSLLRVEGVCSKGHEALKSELTHGAKCGTCPCCALATHVLVPATYDVGRYDRRKANSTLLWQRRGPMATRNYAAAVYYNLYGPLPSSWDWLASKHLVELPHPLDPDDTRMVDEGDSQEGWDDESGPMDSPALPSLATSTPSPAPQPQKVAKPPPPIYPPRCSPSPSQSSVPTKGQQSWGGGWNQKRDSPWDWNSRRWRR